MALPLPCRLLGVANSCRRPRSRGMHARAQHAHAHAAHTYLIRRRVHKTCLARHGAALRRSNVPFVSSLPNSRISSCTNSTKYTGNGGGASHSMIRFSRQTAPGRGEGGREKKSAGRGCRRQQCWVPPRCARVSHTDSAPSSERACARTCVLSRGHFRVDCLAFSGTRDGAPPCEAVPTPRALVAVVTVLAAGQRGAAHPRGREEAAGGQGEVRGQQAGDPGEEQGLDLQQQVWHQQGRRAAHRVQPEDGRPRHA
jgi:hypothetical protein